MITLHRTAQALILPESPQIDKAGGPPRPIGWSTPQANWPVRTCGSVVGRWQAKRTHT
jgi:hypothetical protein